MLLYKPYRYLTSNPPAKLTIADTLVKTGADVNIRIHYNRGDTPLHSAARYNAENIVEFLIKKGADIEATSKTKHNSTPLAITIKNGSVKAANTLHRLGAIVYNLPIAAGLGRTDLINDFFIDGQLTPDAVITHPYHKPPFRLTKRDIKKVYRQAIEFALLNEKFAVVDRFLKSGININDQWGEHQATLLHLVAQHGSPAMAEYLIEQGANVKTPDNQYNQTALQWAIKYNNLKVAAYLQSKI